MAKMPDWVRTTLIAAAIFFLLPLTWIAVVSKDKSLIDIFALVVAVIIAAFASIVLAKIITNDIDIRYLISEDNGNASLSRFQFLLFTFVIAASYFLFVAGVVAKVDFSQLLKDGKPIPLPDIPPTVLGLIGISGASYVVAKGIQKSAGDLSSVVRVHVTNSGAGYTAAPTVTFSGGNGTEARAIAVLENGIDNGVGRIDVTAKGNGYTSIPAVQISGGGGTGAQAHAIVEDQSVARIELSASGSGYSTIPTVQITGGGGTGAQAIAILANGVARIDVTSGGSGYSATPTVQVAGGGGRGATAIAEIV
jgi:hypothetical protein